MRGRRGQLAEIPSWLCPLVAGGALASPVQPFPTREPVVHPAGRSRPSIVGLFCPARAWSSPR